MGVARFRATFSLTMRSEAEALVIAEALRVEALDPLPKAAVTVTASGAAVTISVEAEEPGSLRAAAKSFLSWTKGATASGRATSGAPRRTLAEPRAGPGRSPGPDARGPAADGAT